MVHPNFGYLSNFNKDLSFEEIFWLWEFLVVATWEKLIGQDLLAKEITSFGYWELFHGFGAIDIKNDGEVRNNTGKFI